MEAVSGRRFGRHMHDEFGIGVVLAGAQQSASGRGPVFAQQGNVITVNPGEVHDGHPVGCDTRQWRMLYIDPAVMSPILRLCRRSADAELHHPVLIDEATRATWIAWHRALTRAAGLPDRLLLDSLMVELVGSLVSLEAPCCVSIPQAIQRVQQQIDDEPELDWTLEQLADLSGLSPFHFIRMFCKATGLPPHRYRLQKRLQKARALIAVGTPICEAAVACGFADQSHLHRFFVNAYGYRPGDFARSRAARH
ncbi:MAG: AraC family transcriptional regulator [Ramlibacter sp.]|nr:AraC family transcriptional regulator [Ramlibacter sp.]